MVNLSSQERDKQSIISSVISIARPLHWIKNLAVFAAILLSGLLFEKGLLGKAFLGFIAFNLATSATYIINDVFDAKLDRLHPRKKFRPIASGSLPIGFALFEALILGLTALAIAAPLNYLFFLTVIGYILLQLLYSAGLKNIPTLDILIIATGFILRVYAGAFVIDAHLSVWFLLCVVSTALFLASGKRRAELNLIIQTAKITRTSLERYKKELLNSYVTMFGNASWMSWSLFTFFESPKASLPVWLVLAELSRTTTINKLLMATIPIVIFGIMRYEALIFEGRSETPEKILLTDKMLLVSIGLWVIMVYWIIYSGASILGV